MYLPLPTTIAVQIDSQNLTSSIELVVENPGILSTCLEIIKSFVCLNYNHIRILVLINLWILRVHMSFTDDHENIKSLFELSLQEETCVSVLGNQT